MSTPGYIRPVTGMEWLLRLALRTQPRSSRELRTARRVNAANVACGRQESADKVAWRRIDRRKSLISRIKQA
jgi:hypothetical protein